MTRLHLTGSSDSYPAWTLGSHLEVFKVGQTMKVGPLGKELAACSEA